MRDGEAVFVTAAVTQVTGHPVSEWLGTGWQRLVLAEDLPRILSSFSQAANVRRIVRVCFRITTAAGAIRRLLCVTRPIPEQSQEFALSFIDITSQVGGLDLNLLVRLEAKLRSLPRPQRSHLRVPTISFDLDGTIANTFQAVLDRAFEETTRFPFSWHSLHCKVDHSHPCSASVCFSDAVKSTEQLSPSEFERAKELALHAPRFWESVEAFSDEEMRSIAEDIDTGRYAAMFVSNRVDTPHAEAMESDARLQSVNWLNIHGITRHLHTSFDCIDKVTELLFRGVDYHIDDDPQEVERLRSAGVEAFLVSRPWNRGVECEFRVDSVQQFLDVVVPMGVFVEDLAIAS